MWFLRLFPKPQPVSANALATRGWVHHSASVLQSLFLVLTFLGGTSIGAQQRVVESVIPALAYGPSCRSAVQLQNVGNRPVTVDVEGHRDSGALVGLRGNRGTTVHLNPRNTGTYQLAIDEETMSAWVKVREHVPSTDLSPAISISGSTECVIGNELRTAARGVAYPTRNPWFAGNVADMPGSKILLINTSESAVRVTACYSAGDLYSIPSRAPLGSALQPICTESLDVQVPPFGTREFVVARNGSTYLSLKTQGTAIVLEMLRPTGETSRIYTVDSTIKFGEETPKKH
jgi:hypothetical protein